MPTAPLAEGLQALVLCAGSGSRLWPLTQTTPKALVRIAGVPIILYILDWLQRYGITNIAINLHYLPAAIPSFLGDGSRYHMRITYFYERVLLGTAGALANVAGWLTGTLVVVYGDQLIDVNLKLLLDAHRAGNAVATIGLRSTRPGEDMTQVGVVSTGPDGRVTGFEEKPALTKLAGWGQDGNVGINGGIYVIDPSVIQVIPTTRETPYDLGYHLLPELLRRSLPVAALPLEGYVLDIGLPTQLQQAEADVLAGRVRRPTFSSA